MTNDNQLINYRLHPLHFIILPILWLSVVVISDTLYTCLFSVIITLFNLLIIAKPLHLRALIIFILSLLPMLLALFMSSYFFAHVKVDSATNVSLSISSASTQFAVLFSMRMFCLAFISFAFMYHTPKNDVFIYLAQRKLLSVRIAYALIATFNAASYLKNEFKRIQIAYQMRYQRYCLSPQIIFPLLIAAARYAHQLSISLYSRGLNANKTYVTVIAKYGYLDCGLLAINLLLLTLMHLVRIYALNS